MTDASCTRIDRFKLSFVSLENFGNGSFSLWLSLPRASRDQSAQLFVNRKIRLLIIA